MSHHLASLALLLAIALAGCGTDPATPDGSPGPDAAAPLPPGATGATCPTTSPPTYDTFGQQFFATYCTTCHSSMSANRNGAPLGIDFDTLTEVQNLAGQIDAEAGAGPNATHTFMPPVGNMAPTTAERMQLSEMLACIAAP